MRSPSAGSVLEVICVSHVSRRLEKATVMRIQFVGSGPPTEVQGNSDKYGRVWEMPAVVHRCRRLPGKRSCNMTNAERILRANPRCCVRLCRRGGVRMVALQH
jgi:hypothetical protein